MTFAISPTSAPTPSGVRAELRALVRLAFPIALAQSGLVAMSLVDTAVVGRVSVQDLAAVAMGRSIFFATGALGIGVSMALDPLASQAIGAGKPARAWSALGATLRAGAAVSTVALALALALTLTLAPMGVEPALVPLVQRFLIGQAPGFYLFTAFLAGKNFLQTHGETRPALLAAVVANVVNLVVCNLLVRGDDALRWVGLPALGLPRLGAFGAGFAASVGGVVLAAIVLAAAARHRPAARTEQASERVSVASVVRIGVPVGLQLLAEISVFASMALLAGRFGSLAVSAHQIALSLASFTFMGALGIGNATAVRVGHAVGAGVSPRRAGTIGLLLGLAVMVVSATAFATMPRLLVSVFSPDPEVIDLGAKLLGLAAIFQLFDGAQVIAAGALRGAGDVRFPFVANLCAHWGIGLPLALGLGFGMGLGLRGLWVGLTAGLVVIAMLLTSRFLVISRGVVQKVE